MSKTHSYDKDFHYINPIYNVKYKRIKSEESKDLSLSEQEKLYLKFFNPNRDYKCSMKQSNEKNIQKNKK